MRTYWLGVIAVAVSLICLRLGAIERAIKDIHIPAPQITVVATNTIIRESPVYQYEFPQMPDYQPTVTNYPWGGGFTFLLNTTTDCNLPTVDVTK